MQRNSFEYQEWERKIKEMSREQAIKRYHDIFSKTGAINLTELRIVMDKINRNS